MSDNVGQSGPGDFWNDMQPLFIVENMTFAYGEGKPVLDNVNFSLFPGQKLRLAGANGSGKTTFFRCITGLLKPGRGNIHFDGRILKCENDFVELRRKIGFVLQEADDQILFPTVLEDVAFGPFNLGLSAQDARQCAEDALDLVGLSGFGDRLGNYLSGGEKKLVALASILAMRPRALLLDEPFNGLDIMARSRIVRLLQKLECAMIIVSHEKDCLESICSSSLRLISGKLLPEMKVRQACQ